MTETRASEELASGLEDLEHAAVSGDDDVRARADALLAKWRQWIDELVVQADLGRLDARDELRALVQRLENSYLALKNEVDRAAERGQGRGEQAQRAAGDAIDDLRDGLTRATTDLRDAARSAFDQLRRAA